MVGEIYPVPNGEPIFLPVGKKVKSYFLPIKKFYWSDGSVISIKA